MKSRIAVWLVTCSVAFVLTSCEPSQPPSTEQAPASPSPQASPTAFIPAPAAAVIAAARARTSIDEVYDPSYFSISYPGGDIPDDRGVCTDVVIRAYRKIGIDLQVLVHEDMRGNFNAYPRMWGLKSPDKNIDHRRVPNLQEFFGRKGASLPISALPGDYMAGDLVTWSLPGNLPHIGIVSDKIVPGSNRPLILHNIGAGTSEDDILLTYPITGHFRYYPDGT